MSLVDKLVDVADKILDVKRPEIVVLHPLCWVAGYVYSNQAAQAAAKGDEADAVVWTLLATAASLAIYKSGRLVYDNIANMVNSSHKFKYE